MNYVIKDMEGNVLLETDTLPFVKQDPESKAWISAVVKDCTALAINNQIYGIAGYSDLPDYPLAVILTSAKGSEASHKEKG